GIKIQAAASTGYGEEIIKNAFHADCGIVETIAHFTAASKFDPQVDFIIDIGGQDIKCFKIGNGVIDDIFLNEACSSGCGSFLQTFAGALGYSIEDFSKLGLFADRPVDLGSRCTVFMNSSVKQAQKDGASVENISAGLSISVVKNALYKVIRAVDSKAIGQEIVVQGGTFLNDAVLRAFEQEIGHDVVRPTIAGLMGAYGAALYAREKACAKGGELPQSTLLPKDALEVFTHSVKAITCRGCSNNCKLTVNTFSGGRKFISGNRCEKPVTGVKSSETKYNMFEEKRKLLARYTYKNTGKPVIGIPMGLNMYELLPFWHKFFTTLGYDVMTSPASNRQLYLKGQHTIPSDTACFPAKLMHGHVEALLDAGVDAIFYPCMTYNLDEDLGDNHYNCPVVAYYPEVISSNIPKLKETVFIGDYVGLHRRRDFPGKMYEILRRHLKGDFTKQDVKKASDAAYAEYDLYMRAIRAIGDKFLKIAETQNKPVIVLSGRPYHVDPEINHGIDGLICDCGAVLVTEDAVSNKVEKFPTTVLNQWTYHSRLYAAAKYVADRDDKRLNLIQLVSFGCGVDAITTDEVRAILHRGGRIYTQLKIDEITNLGAVRIRLRSLFAALDLL
ncbi:MAG: acyl-CoA dehydratase activase-related protein, partial [Ruminococcus bromii]|nr:acyl-CoA dehydratase activase-related protein [Ruminococcus bromii]